MAVISLGDRTFFSSIVIIWDHRGICHWPKHYYTMCDCNMIYLISSLLLSCVCFQLFFYCIEILDCNIEIYLLMLQKELIFFLFLRKRKKYNVCIPTCINFYLELRSCTCNSCPISVFVCLLLFNLTIVSWNCFKISWISFC